MKNIITAETIAQHVAELEEENKRLREQQEKLLNADKFYAVKMPLPEVARLHGVDARTVRYYVKCGRIEKHPDSTDGRTYIRGSVALLLDFSELRKTRYIKGYERL